MANPVIKWEKRLIDVVNVAFFFRTMLYAIFIVYCLFIVPINEPTTGIPIFPNVTWFFSNLIIIIILGFMSQANYPNHLSSQETNQRLLTTLLPPVLLLLGCKQRWRDLQILIKRDQYGSILLLTVIFGAAVTTFLYLFTLIGIVFDFGILVLIYVWGYSILLYLPIYLMDRYIIASAGDVQSTTETGWEAVSVTNETRYFNIPGIILLFRTKRRRFWMLLVLVIFYYTIVTQPGIRIPVFN